MSVQNFSFLARLEVAEKFVVVGWGGVVGWWWSRPSLGFSFSQAEQLWTGTVPVNKKLLTGTVPANNELLTGTIPVNNLFLNILLA